MGIDLHPASWRARFDSSTLAQGLRGAAILALFLFRITSLSKFQLPHAYQPPELQAVPRAPLKSPTNRLKVTTMTEQVTLPKEWECLSSSLVPEVKVWITMGDKVLATHKKDTTNHSHVTAEIAGIEGKEFEVHFYDGRTKLTKPFEIRIFLDGQFIRGNIAKKDSDQYKTAQGDPERLWSYSHQSVGQSHKRPFRFGQIATTDNNTQAVQNSSNLSEVGTITIKYCRIKAVKQIRVKASTSNVSTGSSQMQVAVKAEDSQPIDEKLKKAQFGLSAGLGDLLPNTPSSTSSAGPSTSSSNGPAMASVLRESEPTMQNSYDIVDHPVPYITYRFNIRSATVIQDELFVDEEIHSPVASTSGSSKRTSTALEDEDDNDADIDAELKALEEKKARLLAKKAKTLDIKPKVSPPPPFDWQGHPPIDMGKRIYVDFEENDVGDEEKRELENERLRKERIEKGKIEL